MSSKCHRNAVNLGKNAVQIPLHLLQNAVKYAKNAVQMWCKSGLKYCQNTVSVNTKRCEHVVKTQTNAVKTHPEIQWKCNTNRLHSESETSVSAADSSACILAFCLAINWVQVIFGLGLLGSHAIIAYDLLPKAQILGLSVGNTRPPVVAVTAGSSTLAPSWRRVVKNPYYSLGKKKSYIMEFKQHLYNDVSTFVWYFTLYATAFLTTFWWHF